MNHQTTTTNVTQDVQIKIQRAAKNADWMQVVFNHGPPPASTSNSVGFVFGQSDGVDTKTSETVAQCTNTSRSKTFFAR